MTIEQRLGRLSARRTGSDRSAYVADAQRQEILIKALLGESYQKRQPGKPHTQYALGAMAEVDARYTQISIETAARVENQLARRLGNANLEVEFRLQGSVPLNVHIRGVSDIDLLVIATRSFYYAREGVRAQRAEYPPAAVDPIELLAIVRSRSETELAQAYPAVDVDISHPKAIKLSGGSLARPVDVVPAVWWDTAAYQVSGNEVDRGTSIFHKADRKTIQNLPFLHISRVSARDQVAGGGLKKAIRLCKNLKADAEEEGTKIGLSSYDIASLLYHADMRALGTGAVWELAVLAEAQRFFDWCYYNQGAASQYMTPDGSRPVLDTPERKTGLLLLSTQLDDLARKVAKEHSLELMLLEQVGLDQARNLLKNRRLD